MKILQVVGYKNSGKTTLIEKLIKEAVHQGYRVGAVKHHGHGGYPDSSDLSNDSNRHRQAGAIVSSVEGNGLLQLQVMQDEWPLQQILQIYSLFPIDVVLVEGFKKEKYPKVVMLRTVDDLTLLTTLENIIAVITRTTLPESLRIDCPIFSIKNEEQYLQWIMNYVRDAL
ncbi:molybdopterin-guanine dinucleotide biosynthesis protein B [Anoxybacillus calidus]|jgi:molybdopterin-guanine dinucleotide biosynthesis adapter protein|uniref:Molybdopterin-guanine dinucleotide biosynthesis protein B n=1 Tax=[Anoxybacillus] calidus TaxID=575178 RepID=A0A7V9Z0Y9_9BACL|nr:molybdopterin-guanine dinucleotide biosynthesis protein B [Anoxybacillus calidus]MBA2872092.1 molybdopterin-guanine dinucleotide biosynthesis protein B [Anoxybacillus calidus]